MSAQRLHAAARVLRHHATAATPGPWGVGNDTIVGSDMKQTSRGSCSYKTQVCETDPFNYQDTLDEEYAEEQAEFDADYIATVHPGVALALADWLDQTAHDEAWIETNRALRVADLILGSNS